MDRFGPTGKSFEKMNPPLELDHFSRLDRSDRHGPFRLTIPTHSQSRDLAVRYLPCTKWRKTLITVLLGLLTACLSVLLVHTCTVCFGCWRLLKTIYFPKEFGMFFSSFDSNGGVWSHMANISEQSAQNNPLYWLNYYEWSSSHNIIDITVEIVI